MQDEGSFRQVLKRAGKKPHVIDGLVKQVQGFEDYLAKARKAKLEKATAQDLKGYVKTLDPDVAKKRVRGLILYFHHVGKAALAKLAGKIREQGIAKTRKVMQLRELLGVDPKDVAKLKEMGIITTEDLLAAAKTPTARKKLGKQAGITQKALLELVKLSDLARIWAVKSIRTRLYYDAGLDTPDKFTSWDPDELRKMLVDFVKRTGFKGIAPLPKEIRFTIAAARKLPPAVEY